MGCCLSNTEFFVFSSNDQFSDLNSFFKTRDPTLEYFGEALQKYHSEHKDALSVPDKRPIGFLLIDAKAFKETLIPNPLRCLNAVHDLMPILAKQKMQAIIDETNDAIFKVL